MQIHTVCKNMISHQCTFDYGPLNLTETTAPQTSQVYVCPPVCFSYEAYIDH